ATQTVYRQGAVDTVANATHVCNPISADQREGLFAAQCSKLSRAIRFNRENHRAADQSAEKETFENLREPCMA
ncbi:MAG: hypothetical protein ACRDD1_00755, partial [Planctomycetia bacterium]